MPTIRAKCIKCDFTAEVGEEHAGRVVSCPRCNDTTLVIIDKRKVENSTKAADFRTMLAYSFAIVPLLLCALALTLWLSSAMRNPKLPGVVELPSVSPAKANEPTNKFASTKNRPENGDLTHVIPSGKDAGRPPIRRDTRTPAVWAAVNVRTEHSQTTYDEALILFGCKPAREGFDDVGYQTCMWVDGKGGYAIVAFVDGKAFRKEYRSAE